MINYEYHGPPSTLSRGKSIKAFYKSKKCISVTDNIFTFFSKAQSAHRSMVTGGLHYFRYSSLLFQLNEDFSEIKYP